MTNHPTHAENQVLESAEKTQANKNIRPANALCQGYNYFCFPKSNPPKKVTVRMADDYFDVENWGNC